MKMEAVVSREGTAFLPIESVDIDAPRAGEVLIRVEAAGICHTMRGIAGFVTAPGNTWAPAPFPTPATGKSVKGILGGRKTLYQCSSSIIDKVGSPLGRLIRFCRFEDIVAAFKDTSAGETVKPVLRMD